MKKLPKINTAKLLKAALPYIFIGLVATKLGQAYRMVPEGDVLDKALGAFLNIGTAFQNPLPSFHPFDLMVGAAVSSFGSLSTRKPRTPENTAVVRSMALPDGAQPKTLNPSLTRISPRTFCCPIRNG